ncbi:MAG: hypothetical protein KQI35_18675 [Bacteroidetes bacterium]|nr:hypothetical protein [Bacteroidota bacterium]
MKVLILILISAILIFDKSTSISQDSIRKHNPTQTWVSLYVEPFNIEGIFYQVTDSSVLIADYKTAGSETMHYSTIEFGYRDIILLELRKKNSVTNGLLIGTLVGALIGGGIGLASGDDPPCDPYTWACVRFSAEAKAVMLMIPFSIVGAISGALLGTSKTKIPIQSLKKNFDSNRSKLESYALKKSTSIKNNE